MAGLQSFRAYLKHDTYTTWHGMYNTWMASMTLSQLLYSAYHPYRFTRAQSTQRWSRASPLVVWIACRRTSISTPVEPLQLGGGACGV